MYKQDVANIIFGHAASASASMQALRREIKRCRELRQKLKSLSSNDRVHYYNAQQVQLLFEHFGINTEDALF
ncbi:DUF4248 domain-containing protein [Persicobacter psychrovividus]